MNGIETAFEGRLGADAELRESKAGRPWLKMSVCVGDGETERWVKVAVFGKVDALQELARQLLKGSRVYCEGALRVETWTDRDGRERWALSVGCWRCEPLGQIGRNRPPRKPKGGRDGDGQTAPAAAKRDWQRPAPTDARPASGAPAGDALIPL